MSTEPHAQILRIALIPPLVHGVAEGLDVTAPFIAAMLAATLAVRMRHPPPFKAIVVLIGLLALLPVAFSGIVGALAEYRYLLVGVVGLTLFHAFRLQAVAKTAVPGALLQVFALLLPLISLQLDTATAIALQLEVGAPVALSDLALEMFGANGLLAVAGLYLGFALFPERAAATPAEARAAPDPVVRTWNAGVAALVMAPMVAILLAFELSGALRVLFTAATCLMAMSYGDLRAASVATLVSVLVAGAVVIGFGALTLLWPDPFARMLLLALLGLRVAPHAFGGRHPQAVALAIPLVWALIGTAEDQALAQTLSWTVYSCIGVAYAVWARALVLRLLRARLPAGLQPGSGWSVQMAGR